MPENIPSNGLDWQRFSAKYFPGRGRHDFEALTAYGAYKRTRKTGEPAQEAPSVPGSTALEAWEDEGGQ
jgi:hypothetical protein